MKMTRNVVSIESDVSLDEDDDVEDTRINDEPVP